MQAHDDIYEALREAVKALGGAKIVGHAMKPEKTVDQAQGWLLDCLNPARNEKLDPEQMLWLLRMSHDCGHHAAKAFVDQVTGYAISQPLTPENERAELQRQTIDAAARMERLFAQMKHAGLKFE